MVKKEKLEELKKKEVKFLVDDVEIKFNDFTLDHEGNVTVTIKMSAIGDRDSVLKSIQELQEIIRELDYEIYNSRWEVIFRFKDLLDEDEGYMIVNYKEYKKFKEWLMKNASETGA